MLKTRIASSALLKCNLQQRTCQHVEVRRSSDFSFATTLALRQNFSPNNTQQVQAWMDDRLKWWKTKKLEAIMRSLTIWPLLHSFKQIPLEAAYIWRQQCICDGKTSGGSRQPSNPQTLRQSLEVLQDFPCAS